MDGISCFNQLFILLVYLRFLFIKRIGGITGDTVGAARVE
jgi:adenosylcobinamide-GDP ribazoletransferase